MKKVLVVEDSAAVRAMIVSIVQTVPGIECVDAEDGLAALKALPEDQFDAILTDINMPGLTGLELISFVRCHPNYKQIPIIIISTEKTEADRERGLSLGASDYITKPFVPGDLQRVIKHHLGI
ncbi:MAG: response regulator [Blastocatellia bacterium]|nr:response regulator [Blastocatellia bacterium]